MDIMSKHDQNLRKYVNFIYMLWKPNNCYKWIFWKYWLTFTFGDLYGMVSIEEKDKNLNVKQVDLCLIRCQSRKKYNTIFSYICSHWVSNEIILLTKSEKLTQLYQSPCEIHASYCVPTVAQITWRFGLVKKLEARFNKCQL